MMKNEKPRFNADYHAVPGKLAATMAFQARLKLRQALASLLEPLAQSKFSGDVRATGQLAQQLTFLATVKTGWGPTADEIEKVAKNLVDGYLAHRDALAAAGFPAPAEAALETLKGFEFPL